MEDIDYKNRNIPEEVAPYAKQIFKELRETEVIPSSIIPYHFPRDASLLKLATCQNNLMWMRKCVLSLSTGL